MSHLHGSPGGDGRDRHPSAAGRASASPPSDGSSDRRSDVVVIDCDRCARQGTPSCDECVVTFICDREPGAPVVVDLATERAVRLLGEVGLVPTLKHLSSVPPVADVGG